MLETLWENTKEVMLEALPWLTFGFFVSGLLRSFVPANLIAKHLGEENWFAPIKASLLGAPIPLCSCSVIPVAMSLRRGGAGKGALTSFLISAPETGVDSLSISYAMLGPIMVVARLFSTLFTSICTAWAVVGFTRHTPMNALPDEKKSCFTNELQNQPNRASECCKPRPQKKRAVLASFLVKFWDGQRYAFTALLDDSFKWIMIALVFTVLLNTYVPPSFFANYGSGIGMMLLMVLISFPLYICASASTPVAAGMMLLGVSPGAVLVFMLAGPASNIATIGVVSQILNRRSSIVYVLGVMLFSVFAGFTLDWIIALYHWDILSQVVSHNILHWSISIPATIWVLLCAIKPIRPYIGLPKD